MRKHRFCILSGVICIMNALAAPGHASVIGSNSANGALVSAVLDAAYVGAGSGPADALNKGGNALALPALGPTADANANLALSAFSSSLPAKDKIQATGTVHFEFGAPIGTSSNDTVQFIISGDGSAMDAHNSAGNSAAAQLSGKLSLNFYVDTIIAPSGTLVGSLRGGAIRDLNPFEVLLQVDTYKNSILIGSYGPGSPGFDLPLVTGNSYMVQLSYLNQVPFGSDPPFSVGWNAAVLPEPSAFLLLAPATLALLRRKRRV
jgi:hypothetical protein